MNTATNTTMGTGTHIDMVETDPPNVPWLLLSPPLIACRWWVLRSCSQAARFCMWHCCTFCLKWKVCGRAILFISFVLFQHLLPFVVLLWITLWWCATAASIVAHTDPSGGSGGHTHHVSAADLPWKHVVGLVMGLLLPLLLAGTTHGHAHGGHDTHVH